VNRMPAHRGRWDVDYAAHIHQQLDDSGLSLAEFARRHDFSEQRLRWWRSQLRLRANAGSSRVVELIPTRPIGGMATGLRVHCPSGHIVEVTAIDQACALTEVLRAIEAVGC